MLDVARATEDGPFESIWVYDHFHTVPADRVRTRARKEGLTMPAAAVRASAVLTLSPDSAS